MKRMLLLLPLVIFPSFAAAETVRYEVNGALGYHKDSDRYGDENSYKVDYRSLNYSAGLTYYLDEVDTAGVVQRELAFLRRASYVYADVKRMEYKAQYFGFELLGDGTDKFDYSLLTLRGNRFVNDDIYVMGGYSSELAPDTDGSLFGGLGYYYRENASVSAFLSHNLDTNGTEVQVLTRAVVGLGGDSSVAYTFGGSADVEHVSDSMSLDMQATYYFSNYTGVGIAANYHLDLEEFYYDIEVSHYLNNKLGMAAFINDPDEGLNNLHLEATYRF